MWCETHPNTIPYVSGPVYNSDMTTRCNMCMNTYDEDITVCNICLTDDYLMDMSVPSDTIININERI